MHCCKDSSGMKYQYLGNLKYMYWVLLNRGLKLFKYIYTKKKAVFNERRALLDIIIAVQN